MIARPASFTAREVAAAVRGELHGEPDRRLDGVATDTRDNLRDALFVALVGARFDAHDFLASALEAGAGGLLVSREGWARASVEAKGAAVVVCQDTLRGLGDLATAHRQRVGVPVLALTGSNGKTTTKEMVASIHEQARLTLKTEGNLNNLVGVPLTLLGLEEGHDVAVVEMGMNKPGEIARYTEISTPDAGLVLNIGPAHIGELGSIEAIADAKGELFRGLRPDAVAVINADDPRVVAQADRARVLRRRTFGRKADADVRLLFSRPHAEGGQRLTLLVDGARCEADVPLDGPHNALNAAGAVALATARPDLAPVSLEDVRAGLAAVRVPGGRLSLERLGSIWVLDDCYNANRASMQAALETAAARAKALGVRLVALLGEMRELGEFSEEEHAAVGRAAAEVGAAAVAAFGPRAAPIAEAAAAAGVVARHEATDEGALFDWARAQWGEGDIVLLKGSRGIRMERFKARIESEGD